MNAEKNSKVFGTFCSGIEQASAQKLSNHLAAAHQAGASEVHILFQTTGGIVSDGLYLYTLLKSFPIPVFLYNGGAVHSIGALVFLAAKRKIVSKHGLFMLHRSTIGAVTLGGKGLRDLAETADLEDKRTEAIYRSHLSLDEPMWNRIDGANLWLTAEEAVKFGLADTIGDFAPEPSAAFWSFTI